jgi:hypothetical protein
MQAKNSLPLTTEPVDLSKDPLSRLLRGAARRTSDPAVRAWLAALARRGARATGSCTDPVRRDGETGGHKAGESQTPAEGRRLQEI